MDTLRKRGYQVFRDYMHRYGVAADGERSGGVAFGEADDDAFALEPCPIRTAQGGKAFFAEKNRVGTARRAGMDAFIRIWQLEGRYTVEIHSFAAEQSWPVHVLNGLKRQMASHLRPYQQRLELGHHAFCLPVKEFAALLDGIEAHVHGRNAVCAGAIR